MVSFGSFAFFPPLYPIFKTLYNNGNHNISDHSHGGHCVPVKQLLDYRQVHEFDFLPQSYEVGIIINPISHTGKWRQSYTANKEEARI